VRTLRGPAAPDRHIARSRRHLEEPRASRPLLLGTESWPGPSRALRRRVLIRWLEQCAPDEETGLIAAREESANINLVKIATEALETGMRQRQVMELAWERVDFSRGVIRLELTKSGRRR